MTSKTVENVNIDILKSQVGQAAADYVFAHIPKGEVIGVGTGSTANYFIDALAARRIFARYYRGAVSSSRATTAKLHAQGIPVIPLDEVDRLPIYVDGADEIDAVGHMIKGGGGALTREKIVAEAATTFLCIADDSKSVASLGNFALPIEIISFARNLIIRKLEALGAQPLLRLSQSGAPYLTDNGHQILDVRRLNITQPVLLEAEIGSWPGVVTVGLFAKRKADLCLLGTRRGIQRIEYGIDSE